MNHLLRGAVAGVALGLLATSALAEVECSDIEFSSAVTEQFPEIAEACREVVTRDGMEYAKIRADVATVRRNVRDTSDVQRVTLRMLDRDGGALRLIQFRPPRDFTFTVDGQTQTADDMGRGQQLGIYVPRDSWELVWTLETAQPFEERIYIDEVESLAEVLILEADDAFAFDSADLTEDGKDRLDQVLAASGDYIPMIDVVGYTDRIGEDAYNKELSERRAQAAKDYLVGQGVPENRVRAQGKGSADPVVACPGREGEALMECLAPNRRAEVRFMVPLVAEGGRAVVVERYRKPDGEIVSVTRYEDAIAVNPASSFFGKLLDACGEDARKYCPNAPIGEGDMLLCLYEHSPELSVGCTAAFREASALQARRQHQLNVIGDICSSDLAQYCADVPLVDKLACLRDSMLTDPCADALDVFEGLGY